MADTLSPLSSTQLPDEIWAEILAHLPRSSFPHTNLTSWRFHRITRPLLFRDLGFHPYMGIAGYFITSCPPSGLALPGPEQIHLVMERLRFWSSPDIAPLVRSCRIAPWPNSGVHNWPFSRVQDPYVLLTRLFDTFPRFTNLRVLLLHQVHFTESRLQKLGLLPNLTVLEVDMCSVVDGEVINPLALTPLAVSDFRFMLTRSERAIDHWLPLLRLDTLHHLDLHENARLFDQIQTGPAFPCVKSLKIAGNTSLIWSHIVAKFPALEVLVVEVTWRSWTESHAPVANVLPSLREYTGPDGLLYFLLPLPTLRRVTIPLWDNGYPEILARFAAIVAPNNITALYAGLSEYDPQYLEGFSALFPNLTEFRVKITIHLSYWTSGSVFDVESLFESLAQKSPLPIHIRKFAFQWAYTGYKNEPDQLDFGCPDLNDLKNALVAQHPDLDVVWVDDGSDLMYFWRQGRDARMHLYDESESELGRADSQREQFGLLWDAVQC
ncbi:hypothetical protein B0H19DRAFT_1172412 [Mycena capillaripes]|nr:hypothetical protein B0H19DRAFT_1172412 [Mycena capillaripes]